MHGHLHHLELWVDDLAASIGTLGWLLEQLGWTTYQDWERGRSWRLGETYVVVEQSTALHPGGHDRMRPGLNHLALHVDSHEPLVSEALEHGWSLRVAVGQAVHLTDAQGFEVELVVQP